MLLRYLWSTSLNNSTEIMQFLVKFQAWGLMQLYKKEIPSFFHRRLIWEELFSGYLLLWRSSLPEVFCEKGVVRKFTKFTEKHLCQRLFFNKVAGQRPKAYDFIKKEFLAQVFSREFCEISKNTLSYRALLLDSLDATELQQESFIFFT